MKTLGQVSFEHWFATGFFRWEDEDAEGKALWAANAAAVVKADTEARAARAPMPIVTAGKSLGQVEYEVALGQVQGHTGYACKWESVTSGVKGEWEDIAKAIVKADTENRAARVQENMRNIECYQEVRDQSAKFLGIVTLVDRNQGHIVVQSMAKAHVENTIPKTLEEQNRLAGGQAITPRVTGNGATCKRCKEHYPYAEPTEGFTCYGCRNR